MGLFSTGGIRRPALFKPYLKRSRRTALGRSLLNADREICKSTSKYERCCLQQLSYVASWAVEKVEAAANSDPTLTEYVQKLDHLISHPNFALDGNCTNEFTQTLGEAQFFELCLEKGFVLTRIPEQGHKTPDFLLNRNGDRLFFEVKTPSVVDGKIGISKHLDDSFDAQVKIEEQLRAGKNSAFAISVVQPYGKKTIPKGKGCSNGGDRNLDRKNPAQCKAGPVC